MTNDTVIFENVTKMFKTAENEEAFAAVEGIDLRIAQGEFFTLLGPSGCGKTTTLRLIAGFEMPTSGRILINGKDVSDEPPYRRPVHTVFQNYALFPHMSVAQNVAYGLVVNRVPRDAHAERVEKALNLVQMGRYARRKPTQLSGGQQQRVALARALVNNPAVLLLDEPLGALDLKLRKDMQIELKELQLRLGITFVYVTHDQEEALSMSDRIAILNEGHVVQVGSPQQIYNEPNSRFTADFVGATNFLTAEVVESKASEVTLQIGEQQFALPLASEPLAGGTTVTLSIRPERVYLELPAATNGLLRFDADVERAAFAGSDHRYTLLLAHGERLTALVRNRQDLNAALLEPGSKLTIGIAPSDVSLLVN